MCHLIPRPIPPLSETVLMVVCVHVVCVALMHAQWRMRLEEKSRKSKALVLFLKTICVFLVSCVF